MTLLKNNVKKIFVLILALLASFSLVACKEEEEIDPETKISEALGSIALGDTNSITQSFDLVKVTGKHQLTITWSVTNLALETVTLDLTGEKPQLVVTQDPYTEDENGKATNQWGEAELTATVTVGDKSSSRKWEIWVKPAENVLDMTIAEVVASKDSTNVAFSGVVSYVHAGGYYVSDSTGSIYVYGKPTNSNVLAGAEVTVEGEKITYYNQPEIESGSKVKVDKFATDAGYDYTKTAVDAYIPELVWQPATNTDMYGKIVNLKGKIVEVTSGANTNYGVLDDATNTKIMFYYQSDADFINAVKAKVDKYVSVSAIIYNYHSGEGVWRAFGYKGSVTELTAAPTYTDTDKLNLAAVKLAAQFNDMASSKDITLPATGEFSSTITWVSKNTAIVANDGKVTSPATDTEVELTATITLGTGTKEVTVKVKVLAPAASVPKTVAELIVLIDAEEATGITVEGVIIGQDSDGYFYLADATGVVYVRNKLSDNSLAVGDKVRFVGNGTIYDKSKRYARQFNLAEGQTIEKIDKAITPIAPITAQISDFDNTITKENFAVEVPKETHFGKLVTVEGYVVLVGSYGDPYLAQSLDEGANKLCIYYKGINVDAFELLVGKKITITTTIYEYNFSNGWTIGYLGREGDLVYTPTQAELEGFAETEIEKVVTEGKAVTGNLAFFTASTDYSVYLDGVTFAFTSKNTAIIAADGKFTAPDTDTDVEIEVVVTFSETLSKTFTYTVKAKALPKAYSTDFEASNGFVASTTYNNVDPISFGPAGEQWSVVYGTAATTGAISGSQSLQMRWYTSAVDNLGYAATEFSVANVDKVEFKAASTSGLKVKVSYSTDGTTFTGEQTFDLTGTATTYTYDLTVTGAVYIKFSVVLPETAPTSTSRVYIDDVQYVLNK